MNRKHITTCIVAAVSVLTMGAAPAALLLPNSFYQMTLDVNTSSLTVGALPGTSSYAMTDYTASSNGTPYGVIDGYAGVLIFQTDNTGENLSVTSFQVDPIFATFGGDFFQYTNTPSQMSGFIDNAGNMSLDLTSRMAEVEAFPSLGAVPFNINSGGTGSYNVFTTGDACNLLGCITGSSVTPSGLPNEFKVTLVSAGEFGAAWDAFEGTSYFEVWESQNTIKLLGPVPVPAAIWLFGSGLLGLIGIARRKAA